MATLTLAQLAEPRTLDQIRERIFARLNAAGFPITDFHSGGVERTTLEAVAEAIRDGITYLIAAVAGSGLIEMSEGDWLTLLAAQGYRLERVPAASTIMRVKLIVAPGAGPYTQAAGDLVVRAEGGNRYVLDEAVAVPAGGDTGAFTFARFRAEQPGSAYADAPGTIGEDDLVTSLPGVTASNAVEPGSFTDVSHAGTGSGTMTVSGTPTVAARFTVRIRDTAAAGVATFEYSQDGGPWLTGGVTQVAPASSALAAGVRVGFTGPLQEGDTYVVATPSSPILVQGRDVESDEDLRARLRARWPALSEVGLEAIYELWAKEASPDVTRVTVSPANSALTPGGVRIVIGGFVNPLPGSTQAVVTDFIGRRAPPTVQPIVVLATPAPIAVAGVVTVVVTELEAVQTKAQALWDAYLQSLPMGAGTVVRVAELAQALMDAGAVDFDELRIGPPGEPVYERITLGADKIATSFVSAAGVLPVVTGIRDQLTWVLTRGGST